MICIFEAACLSLQQTIMKIQCNNNNNDNDNKNYYSNCNNYNNYSNCNNYSNFKKIHYNENAHQDVPLQLNRRSENQKKYETY